MDANEIKLANSKFDIQEYEEWFSTLLCEMKVVGINAAKEYDNTYRQGGKIMRFADIYRKFKRLEKEFLFGCERKREKAQDDLKDLAVYCIVFMIYLNELENIDG